jgi:hypothetical protein
MPQGLHSSIFTPHSFSLPAPDIPADARPNPARLLLRGQVEPGDSDTAGIREALKDRDTETRYPLE